MVGTAAGGLGCGTGTPSQRHRPPWPARPATSRKLVRLPVRGGGAADEGWAGQRLILKAIEAGVITEEQRLSRHDLKRKGVSDTKGTKRDKQDAAGLTEPMMNVYDLSVSIVEPADVA